MFVWNIEVNLILQFWSSSGLSRRFGTLPYLPFAWLVYSVFLVFKVGLIFTTYVKFFQSTDDNYQVELYQNQSLGCSSSSNGTGNTGESKPFRENESVLELGPNLLKLAVGSTALVFIIILQVNDKNSYIVLLIIFKGRKLYW